MKNKDKPGPYRGEINRISPKFLKFKQEAIRMGVPAEAFWGDNAPEAGMLHCSCFGTENGSKGLIEGFYELWKWHQN